MIEGHHSREDGMESGESRASVLGPLSFLIFVFDPHTRWSACLLITLASTAQLQAWQINSNCRITLVFFVDGDNAGYSVESQEWELKMWLEVSSSNIVCSMSLMAMLFRFVGGLSKCFCQGLWLADLYTDVIVQSMCNEPAKHEQLGRSGTFMAQWFKQVTRGSIPVRSVTSI